MSGESSGLPAGWAWSTLGAIGEYLNGRGFKKSEWREAGRPIIRIQNLTGSGAEFNYFEGEADERHIVRDGDLLISWAATLGVFVWRGPEAVLNQHIFKVRSCVHDRFHRYLVEDVLDDLRRQAHGSGMVHITKKRFDETPVPVPPLEEQERIVAAIEEHFSRLAAADAELAVAIAKLTALRQRILDGAFIDVERWTTVDDVATVRGGIQKQPKRRPVKNRYAFLRVANVMRNQLDLTEVHEVELFEGELERFRLEVDDLLVVEGNGSSDQIGRSARWLGVIPDSVHQNHLIRVRPGPDLDAQYLNWYWNSPANSRQLSDIASSTSGLYTLSTSKVKQVKLPLPPIDEQRKTVARIELQLGVLDRLEDQLTRTRGQGSKLRVAVLRGAFDGYLTHQDPSDEPASKLLDRIATERALVSTRRKRATP